MIGLTCDGEIDASMHTLHKGNNIYYATDSHYSSYPFPSEWIELFSLGGMKNEYIDNAMESASNYNPVISHRELVKFSGGSNIRRKYRKLKIERNHKSILVKNRFAISSANRPYINIKNFKGKIMGTKRINKKIMEFSRNYSIAKERAKSTLLDEIDNWKQSDDNISTLDIEFSRNKDKFMNAYKEYQTLICRDYISDSRLNSSILSDMSMNYKRQSCYKTYNLNNESVN